MLERSLIWTVDQSINFHTNTYTLTTERKKKKNYLKQMIET